MAGSDLSLPDEGMQEPSGLRELLFDGLDYDNLPVGTPIPNINTLHTVDVGNIPAVTFEYNGQVYVYMRKFLEAMGIMWNMQFAKVKDQVDCGIDRYKLRKFRIPSPADNSMRIVVCIPLSTLQIFLFGISFMRMPTHDRRLQVIWLQDHAKRIIEEYWRIPSSSI